MKNIQHAAFYIAHGGDKDWLMKEITEGRQIDQLPALQNLKGEIFSNTTLQYFIDEEIRHDHFRIGTGRSNTLANSSSGEQRQALLSHMIAKRPDYIIVDSLFDSFDKEASQLFFLQLKALSEYTLFIQLFSRKNELLPFIKTVYVVDGKSILTQHDSGEFKTLFSKVDGAVLKGTIPLPIARYKSQIDPLVRMNNVSVQYNGRKILQNICWEINAGEFWQLTGPNGSGKSTLLSLITGNNPKGYGQDLVLFGRQKGSGETVWQIKEKIGYFIPTMASQFERQDSIEQMIISGFFDSVGLYIKPSDRQVNLAREWLALIGMDKDKNHPFRLYPAGKQRLILIARAMVKHPPLLILDEPTSGLDDEMASVFIALINKIALETGTAVLYVSHKEEAGLLPNKIFRLIPGVDGSLGQIV